MGIAGRISILFMLMATFSCGTSVSQKDSQLKDSQESGKLTYEDVRQIIVDSCLRCHGPQAKVPLGTFEQMRDKRAKAIELVDAGKMPSKAPEWHLTAEGVKLLEWLRNGQEFL